MRSILKLLFVYHILYKFEIFFNLDSTALNELRATYFFHLMIVNQKNLKFQLHSICSQNINETLFSVAMSISFTDC
jgi:hypothetical protein